MSVSWPRATWSTRDGRVRLYLGDCLTVLSRIADESVEMVWTDPPYGHANATKDLLSRRHEVFGGTRTVQAAIANDGNQAAMRRVVDGMLAQVARILRCCCCCCCCGGGGPKPSFAWLADRMDRGGLKFFHAVIWDKRNPGLGFRYRRQTEMVMVGHRAGGKLSWPDSTKRQPNLISLSKPRGGRHPNEKPVALVEKFIDLHTAPGDLVLDPFMGSGTTGVAALNKGRRFVGIESDPFYFETAKSRIRAAIAAN